MDRESITMDIMEEVKSDDNDNIISCWYTEMSKPVKYKQFNDKFGYNVCDALSTLKKFNNKIKLLYDNQSYNIFLTNMESHIVDEKNPNLNNQNGQAKELMLNFYNKGTKLVNDLLDFQELWK